MRLHEIITEERRVPCDKCGGSGNVEAHGGMPINFADKMWPDMETCPECKGEGTIAMSDWWGWNTDLDEEQLDELNRRDFLRQATLATMGVGLGAAALDQGKSHDEVDDDMSAEVDDDEKETKEKERKG